MTVNLQAVDGGTTVQLIREGLTGPQETAHAEGWNHFLDRLVLLAGTGDAGPDEWSAAPHPMDELASAEAARRSPSVSCAASAMLIWSCLRRAGTS